MRENPTIAHYEALIAHSGLISPRSLVSNCCNALAKKSKLLQYVCTKCNRACHMSNLGPAYTGPAGGHGNFCAVLPADMQVDKNRPNVIFKGITHKNPVK